MTYRVSKDKATQNIDNMFTEVIEFIKDLKADGKDHVKTVDMSEKIGDKFGLSGPEMYPILRILFKQLEADNHFKVKKGRTGGIYKIVVKADIQPVVQAAVTQPALPANDSVDADEAEDDSIVDDMLTV